MGFKDQNMLKCVFFSMKVQILMTPTPLVVFQALTVSFLSGEIDFLSWADREKGPFITCLLREPHMGF